MNPPKDKIVYMFDCPMHGWECGVFCFRGSDKYYAARWHKFHVTYVPVEWKECELEATIFAASFKRSKT